MVASVLGMDLAGAHQRGRGGPGGWVLSGAETCCGGG